ncbi:MAG: cell division protein SepF [Oscillospiraceae bacterium]|nr:cell division protein SepF [Oscillospiraceae bacterium]
MGLMDELRKLAHPFADKGDDEYDEYDDEEIMEEEVAPAPSRTTYTTRGAAAVSSTPLSDSRSSGRVMSISSPSTMQVIVVKPERFDQVTEIADRLRDKQSVVLNLESTNKDVARRLVDFLSGCAYALDGNIQKVAISTYLITPYNVEVLGDNDTEAEPTAAYF